VTYEVDRTGEVWILGATGRIGAAVARRLSAAGVPIALVGRSYERLVKAQADLGKDHGVRVVVADSLASTVVQIGRERPAVVINTVGSYADTAVSIARACMPGGHYLDLAADLVAIPRLLDLDAEAIAARSTLVTGAGFGVLATEAVVAKLCEGHPTPSHVHVDALSSVATDSGVMGEALAATVVDVITTGGRRFQGGFMVKTPLGSDVQTHELPDGQTIKSASAPSGELLAAQRASGAPNVTVTTGLAPTSPVVRAALPMMAALLSIPTVRRMAIRQMAKIPFKAAPRPRTHSWGHATVNWPDGTRRDGWLRCDDGMDFTADVAALIATRLAHGEGRPGAYTPAVVFGPDLATSAGGTFLLG
jgi:short subunit dehydrogenase-like uncharacterized protein